MKITKETEEKVIFGYKNGSSINSIVSICNISYGSIRNILIRNNIERRSVGNPCGLNDSDINNICDLYEKGNSTVQIGKKYKVANSTIWNILKENNVETRKNDDSVRKRYEIDKELRSHQSNIRKDSPSGALGKTWELSHTKKYPTRTGENNHFWKGGKTKLSQEIKNLGEFSFWRLSVFRRDKFTCQHCGAKNKKGGKYIFDTHHIYPFSKILEDFNIDSTKEAIDCEKLWDVNNGITLCRECHKKTDTWGIGYCVGL